MKVIRERQSGVSSGLGSIGKHRFLQGDIHIAVNSSDNECCFRGRLGSCCSREVSVEVALAKLPKALG